MTGPVGDARREGRGGHALYSSLVGLTALTVLLQAVWAGLFLRHAGTRPHTWVSVHSGGANVAILLAAVTTVVALRSLRHRRDLVVGSAVLTFLLVVETVLGNLINDGGRAWLTVVHIPLAMALMGLVVWLPVRAGARR